ncbi:MAG TPA: hypothetical protein VGA12_00710 [Burkholderiales bacterium]|jgi:hypothetical protein
MPSRFRSCPAIGPAAVCLLLGAPAAGIAQKSGRRTTGPFF